MTAKNYAMQLAWRKLFIAGVAGLTCGKLYSLLVKYPETVRPILQLSAASGVVGTLLGLGVSAYRSLPTHVYAVSVGANFAIASGVFLGLRHILLTSLYSRQVLLPQHTSYISSATSGGATGAVTSIVSRHSLRLVLMTCSGGVVMGLCGQLLYDRFELWRKRKAIELHYPELAPKRVRVKWDMETLQSRFLGFWHQSSKSGKVDERIFLLEEAIKEETAQLAKLDEQLGQTEDTRTHSSVGHVSASVTISHGDFSNMQEHR